MSHPKHETFKANAVKKMENETTVEGRLRTQLKDFVTNLRSLPVEEWPAAVDSAEAEFDDIVNGIVHGVK